MWLLLLTSLSFASEDLPSETQTQEADYVSLPMGAPAPFEGLLFTSESISSILSKHNEEISLLESSQQLKIDDLNSRHKLEYDLLKLRYNSETLMYQEMIEVRNEQIKNAAKKDKLQKWGAYGAFVFGAATSVAIFYSVNHN